MRDARELSGAWADFQRHGFAPPGPGAAQVVARYWWARWDLRGQPDYVQLIVPYPSVQLTFGEGAPMVRGVARGRVRRTLSGLGSVFGVTFRPGIFRRFLGAPVDSVTDRAVPAAAVFGDALPAVQLSTVAAFEDFLQACPAPPDPDGDEVASWMADIAASPGLLRVEHLTRRYGVPTRRLQRLFADHVGVGPKWVLRRYRLHEVTQRMAARAPIDWAGLAADLGYADQAHLVRDFTRMYGESPTAYAARY
ncbi:helix-turn-helix domain-containing protein [Dactylosporangium salmoneum]|uniref:Helix-turn-helix domain-containing protein n=1 Tax=Dactylosporangium salmoneum TaxID=53361 RepID=A0ABP5V750_9ACTN